MKKMVVFSMLLLIAAFISLPYPLLAKDDKSIGKDTTDPNGPKFIQTLPYLNFLYFPTALPTLFYPNLQLKSIFPNNNFNPQLLKIKRPKKKLGRAALEGVGHFIYATSSYWIRQDVMKEDWEYQFTWEDQKRRFLFMDGMRFDSNTFQFNWTHPLAGAIYYNYARANHLNPLESFLFCFGASYFWEFVIEFKEVVSINDMISTPMGGIIIGESLFQLGRLFRSKKPTFLNKVARFISNPVLSLNGWLDRKKYKNQYAYEEDFWNDCRLFIGPRFDTFSGRETDSLLKLGMESQINLIPEYGRPDVSSRTINHPAFTQFNIWGVFNKKGLYEYNIFAKSVLFGYFMQNIRPASAKPQTEAGKDNNNTADANVIGIDDESEAFPHEKNKGYSLFVGLATCFDIIEKSAVNAEETIGNEGTMDFLEKTDKHCIINLFGPTVDLSLFHKQLKVRLVADAYGDFSLIHSHAYRKYSELNNFGQTKSTLENHGYYYALGITLSSMLQVNYSNIEMKGMFKYHYFDSVEGQDRFQKDIAEGDDFDLKDHRWFYNFSLGYRIPHSALQLVIGFEQWDRKGYIREFVQQSTERRSYFQVNYLF